MTGKTRAVSYAVPVFIREKILSVRHVARIHATSSFMELSYFANFKVNLAISDNFINAE